MKKKIILILIVVISIIMGACGGQTKTSDNTDKPISDSEDVVEDKNESDTKGVSKDENDSDIEIPESVRENISIAVIKNLGHDEHATQILSGAVQEGTSLGFKVDTFVTGDDAEFADRFEEILLKDYDGIFFTHGQTNIVELVKKANSQGVPVIGFDSPETPVDLDNVARTAQDDTKMAELSLQALVDDFPDKKPKVIKMLVNGFPAQEIRDVVWKDFVERGLVEEVTNIAEIGDWSNVAGLNANAIAGVLSSHEEGSIDAVWAAWDAFATGAHVGIKENNRQEIRIYSVDVANADLQNMQEDNSSWVMTAAADAKAVGVLNIRLLAKMIAGEEVPEYYELPITAIYREDLLESGGQVTVEDLGDVYDTWGKSESFLEPWMEALKEENAK